MAIGDRLSVRRSDEKPLVRRGPTPDPTRVDGLSSMLLRLQASAGNQAVAALVQRVGDEEPDPHKKIKGAKTSIDVKQGTKRRLHEAVTIRGRRRKAALAASRHDADLNVPEGFRGSFVGWPDNPASELVASPAEYVTGQHGAKGAEQTALSNDSIKVSGDTHESEHVFGYAVLAGDSGLDRKKSPGGQRLEREGWAYQEVAADHRAHPGTGSKGTDLADPWRFTTADLSEEGKAQDAAAAARAQQDLAAKGALSSTADGAVPPITAPNDPSAGWTSKSYRLHQRNALEEGNVGNAIQLNQLAYGHSAGFKRKPGDAAQAASDDSFRAMLRGRDQNVGGTPQTVGGMDAVTIAGASPSGEAMISDLLVSDEEKAEAELSRRTARGDYAHLEGGWPDEAAENEVRKLFKLKPITKTAAAATDGAAPHQDGADGSGLGSSN